MKILKGCLNFSLSIILFFTLLITTTTIILITSLFDPTPIKNLVNKLDFDIVAKEVSAGISEQDKEDPESDKEAFNQTELQDSFDEFINSLATDERQEIRNFLNSSIDEGYDYMKNSNKQNLEFDITEIKRIAFTAIVRSQGFLDNAEIPFKVCQNESEIECIPEEDFIELFIAGFEGNLSQEKIEDIIPICEEERNRGCLTQEEIDKLVESNVNRDTDNSGRDEFIDEFTSNTVIVKQSEIPGPIKTIKQFTEKLTLFYLGLILINLLPILLILAINKAKGFGMIAKTFIFVSIIGFGLAILSSMTLDILNDWYLVDLDIEHIEITKYINQLVTDYSDKIRIRLIFASTAMLLVSCVYYLIRFLRRDKKDKK